MNRIIYFIFFIVIFAVIIVDVLGSGNNQLGRLINWFMIVGALVAVLQPKKAIIFFVISLFYLDFFKRLLIVGDGLSMQDVIVSLGAGPVIIIFVCLYCTVSILLRKIAFRRIRDWCVYIGCLLISVLGFFLEGEELLERGKSMMGTAVLGMTCLATYCLYRKPDDVFKALKYIAIGSAPMACYTVWQFFFGIATWEENYILSGLSPTLYNTYIVAGGAEYMRPFSTLNLHPSVGAVSGTLMVIAFAFLAKESLKNRAYASMLPYFGLGILLLASLLFSQNRTTYFLPIFYFLFSWFFQNGKKAFVLYFVSSIAAFILVLNSEYIYDNILGWSDEFTSTEVGDKFGTLGTYQARLVGFIHMSEIENWKPFGFEFGYEPFSHDPISQALFKFGYVPLMFVGVLSLCVLRWWHKWLYKVDDDSLRKFLIQFTALIAALSVCGLLYGNLIFVSPVNAVLGMLIGAALGIRRNHDYSENIEDKQRI